MVAESPFSSDDGIKRFLDDLRSYCERRSAEDRRKSFRNVSVERRLGVDRRSRIDRRRQSVGSYGPRMLANLERMLADANERAACPECGGSLMLGPPARIRRRTVRRIQCTGCRRSVELPVADRVSPAAGGPFSDL